MVFLISYDVSYKEVKYVVSVFQERKHQEKEHRQVQVMKIS